MFTRTQTTERTRSRPDEAHTEFAKIFRLVIVRIEFNRKTLWMQFAWHSFVAWSLLTAVNQRSSVFGFRLRCERDIVIQKLTKTHNGTCVKESIWPIVMDKVR